MHNLLKLPILFFLICSLACKEEKQISKGTVKESTVQNETKVSPEAKKGTELLEKCIDAHGGMDRWNSFAALAYDLDDKGKMVYQITQLKDRRAYLRSKEYEVGFDGKVAWAVPNAKKVSGASAAFYYNLDFYFIGIPFLLKDKGVNTIYAGKVDVDGKPYESLKITFKSNVGLTPKDIYYMYIDPESFMLHILTYSISYFDSENAKINSAKVYSDYEEVQGLLMPTKMENFEWDADAEAIGKSKEHIRIFSDITFLKEVSDYGVFEVPDGAVTERVN